MAALSCLRNFPKSYRIFHLRWLSGKFLETTAARHVNSNIAAVRQMSAGHKKTLEFVHSSYEWNKWKDHVHFYVLLGAIPITLLIAGVNLFIGPAELRDIPEGYEPKHWEYYKSPITRFISRYLHDSPEKLYERHLHFVAEEKEKMIMRRLEKKVELLVGEAGQRYDSKRWYYVPVNDRIPAAGKKFYQNTEDLRGYNN